MQSPRDGRRNVERLPELTQCVQLFVAFVAVDVGHPGCGQKHVVTRGFIKAVGFAILGLLIALSV